MRETKDGGSGVDSLTEGELGTGTVIDSLP